MIRTMALLILGLVSAVGSGSAQAQSMVWRSAGTAPVLGTTIRGTTASSFSISTSGAVTRVSGDAIRLSQSSVTTPTISINCGLLNLGGLCALRHVRITVSPASTSGAARITRLRVGSLSGSTYRTGSPPPEGSIVTFDIAPLGLLRTATFSLGMDVALAANAQSGVHGFDYVVTAEVL